MQEVKSGVGGPAVCHFRRKSRKSSDGSRSPAQIWVLRASAPAVPSLPVADAGCLWLVTPRTPKRFGGPSHALGTCQPPSRRRPASAVPVRGNDAPCPSKLGSPAAQNEPSTSWKEPGAGRTLPTPTSGPCSCRQPAFCSFHRLVRFHLESNEVIFLLC